MSKTTSKKTRKDHVGILSMTVTAIFKTQPPTILKERRSKSASIARQGAYIAGIALSQTATGSVTKRLLKSEGIQIFLTYAILR